ncbi:MAG: hypothetical protein Q7S35_13770 [Candidatus Limnocylindrales bacterium]|nr:hypothetical protein [Candidatus Limnocylindrales bacterium]
MRIVLLLVALSSVACEQVESTVHAGSMPPMPVITDVCYSPLPFPPGVFRVTWFQDAIARHRVQFGGDYIDWDAGASVDLLPSVQWTGEHDVTLTLNELPTVAVGAASTTAGMWFRLIAMTKDGMGGWLVSDPSDARRATTLDRCP